MSGVEVKPMRTAILVGIAVLLATPTGAGDLGDNIATFCEREWGTDYAMQKHCKMEQLAAATEMGHYASIPEGPVANEYIRIIGRCKDEWTDGGIVDWAMTQHCAERQIEAFKALVRSRQ